VREHRCGRAPGSAVHGAARLEMPDPPGGPVEQRPRQRIHGQGGIFIELTATAD